MRRNLFICLLLAGVTLAIYWPVRHYGLVYYDDPLLVTDNPEINSGLNWHSVWWALSGILAANWLPVTNGSFVLTHQWFGTNPGAEHVVNVVFHVANAVLLFLVLQRMTKAPGCSLVAAALFAWHPLRVESVAWISERKDVLCGFFFLLTLLCYARAVTGARWQVTGTETAPSAIMSRVTCHRSRFYRLALVFFALALMSKPMAVTLPFVLLLLDIWPLKRVTGGKWQVASDEEPAGKPSTLNPVKGRGPHGSLRPQLSTLLLEKWPFFALSAIFSVATYEIQKNFAAMVPFDRLALGDRLENAMTSYWQYLVKLFWPAKLAVIYPYPQSYDAVEAWLIALLLLAVSALCVGQIVRRPYLAVGWFWYLGTAIPIIGLVQVGAQAMADRYTYIPLIGPVISLVWLISEFWKSNSFWKFARVTVTLLPLAACIILTRQQLQHWRDTVRLFERAVEVTTENSGAQSGLAVGLEHAGRIREAMVHCRIATALNPRFAEYRHQLGQLLIKQARWQEAAETFSTVLDFAPNDLDSHLSLAMILPHLGRTKEAVLHLEAVVQINPDTTEALNNFAWLLATCPEANIRNGARAVQLAGHACELTDYRKTIFVGTLAAAYAEAGRYDEAMATAQKACALAEKNHEPELLQKNQELLELFRAHKAYHEPAATGR